MAHAPSLHQRQCMVHARTGGDVDAGACIASWHKTSWPSQNCCVYTSVASGNLSCVGANQVFDTDDVMFSYQSLTTPKTVYRYDMRTAVKAVVKTTPVKGYDADKYATTRMEVTVRDGTKVPVSLAWRKDAKTPKGPTLLSGYGSYGVSNDPTFSREDVPLMDRGVVMAVAHVRGGGEMGRHWYEKEGKYLTKKNTFNGGFISIFVWAISMTSCFFQQISWMSPSTW